MNQSEELLVDIQEVLTTLLEAERPIKSEPELSAETEGEEYRDFWNPFTEKVGGIYGLSVETYEPDKQNIIVGIRNGVLEILSKFTRIFHLPDDSDIKAVQAIY